MKVYGVPQLSPEWWELHRGRVTGSSMNQILTPKQKKPSAQQKGLILELIGQVLGQEKMGDHDGYVSNAMLNGIKREPEARNWYALECGLDVLQVGFIESDCGRFGVSPDGLVGEEGGLELKCPMPKTHAEYLLDGVLPADYAGQVHGSLIVTGRKWWDFVSYCHGMEPFKIRVEPDGFTTALADELERFWEKYQAALAKVRGEK